MQSHARWRRPTFYAAGAIGLAVIGYGAGQGLGTLRLQAEPPARVAALPDDPLTESRPGAAEAASLDPNPEGVVLAQKKRIMGRLRSLEQVRRVATTIRPIVDRAIEQPSIHDDLRDLAARAGMSLEEYKQYFTGKQEADLLLESGGDPNARSVADAIGVAQFLAGTGRAQGLRVDLAASNRLSRKIAAMERQIRSLEAQSPSWTKAVPTALRGVVPAVSASSDDNASLVPVSSPAPAGSWNRDQWLAYRKSQRQSLVMKRRQVDHRYDPDKAIHVQTRYLVRLTRRYGGVDWALQAYHGGEGGASKTMRLFAAAGSRLLLASRGSYGGGGWIPYGVLYQSVSPAATPGAFNYLFGRSDDHRYYWWKVLMAERALNLYRNDPAEFEEQWRSLKPGLNADAVWYPEPATLEFADNSALRSAYLNGTLVALPRNAPALGLRTQNLAALAPANAGLHKGLRPEAMGALLRLAHHYRSHGGAEPLTLLSMVESAGYRDLWNARYPDPPLPPDVPKDPEFHTMGVTFDLKTPSRDWDRKVLEFALGRLYDNLRISWRKETEAGSRRYHVVVNPAYKSEMTAYYQKAVR